MVEAEGKEEKEAAENNKRCEKTREAKGTIYRRRRQPLTSNHGH
jgi:hypothetical protein